MNTNPAEQGRFTEHARGLGTVTKEMVRQRAQELAAINGRTEDQVLDSDLDLAYRELTGREGLTPHPTQAEEVPEGERWEAAAGSTGAQAPKVPAPDEQTFAEKLVEEGVEDAEQDQMARAAREERQRSTPP